MSPRSDPDALSRPDDHIDSPERGGDAASVAQPKLGFVGWVRFGWRQLTSMRTALLLLLLLAIAAVPGSLVPQRSSDPNGVTQYFADNPAAPRRMWVNINQDRVGLNQSLDLMGTQNIKGTGLDFVSMVNCTPSGPSASLRRTRSNTSARVSMREPGTGN